MPASPADDPSPDGAAGVARRYWRPVVVVMGVTGTGKTTVGTLLANRLRVPYAEADAFHPPDNIVKMSAGVPLEDADRWPWLDALGAWARQRAGRGGVFSCSALKRSYRDRLRAATPDLCFVHLTGGRELIAERLVNRPDHFMLAELLDTQLATLEPLERDERGVEVPIEADPQTVTDAALARLAAVI